jgi:hypothetical protein
MKTRFILYLLLFVTFSFAQKKQSHFKTEIDFGNGTVFSTFLDIVEVKDQFTITSPENADVRIMGGKAKMGRMLGKSPKKGIIITIKGDKKNDSLFGVAKTPLTAQLKFKGVIKNNVFSGVFINNDAVSIGSIKGVISTENRNNYKQIYPILLKTINDNIYSKSVLQTKEWNEFLKKMEKLFDNAHDDIELFFGFNMLAKELPFSHLNLFISKDEVDSEISESKPSEKAVVVFEEKNINTAYLLIKNFSNSTEELQTRLPKIIANENYKNLIVDLRNNKGGGIEAAFEFAKYINEKDTEVGYFVTNKLQYSGYQTELFSKLPELQPKTTDEFINDLKKSPGAKLIFKKPNSPIFKGTIYLLTNGKTASTCEPIVYYLKNSKRAVVIGEKTAGAMLAAAPFDLYGKYKIILPLADFYTYDGIRLDNVGVNPDIEAKSDDALEKAMELINNDKNN